MRVHGSSAVYSRDEGRGRAFAHTQGLERAYASIGDLARDPEIDAVYIATPPVAHASQAKACLQAGKAVLCEKPFAMNASEAAEIISLARERGVFLMEAMWTRFLPAVAALRELLRNGRLGAPQLLIAGGAFIPAPDPGYYLFAPQLGGGALLDAGVYLLSLATLCLGMPTRVMASAAIGSSGIDENDALLCEHVGGAKSLLYVSLRARRPPDLELLGSAGRVRLSPPVFRPTQLTLVEAAQDAQTLDYPVAGSGYGYQLRAVTQALRQGETESPVMSLTETLLIMQMMDECRRQWHAAVL